MFLKYFYFETLKFRASKLFIKIPSAEIFEIVN